MLNLTPFDESDYDGFAGAERPLNAEPLIAYFESNNLDGYAVVDASGIEVGFYECFGPTEDPECENESVFRINCPYELAKIIAKGLPDTLNQKVLTALGFSQIY